MARVLIVEDDAAIGQVLQRSLQLEGYEVSWAPDGVAALEQAYDFEPDAVILDLGLPRLDGIDVAKRIRKDSGVPILMLTAREGIESRVEGLDAGADDYLVKPFALDELNARVRALLRRAGADDDGDDRLAYRDLELDLSGCRARRGDRPLELTRTEQRLLELLLRNPEQVLPRDMIYERVWGHDISATSNSLDVYVGYLRRKTEEEGEPRLIHTVRGVGFMLAA